MKSHGWSAFVLRARALSILTAALFCGGLRVSAQSTPDLLAQLSSPEAAQRLKARDALVKAGPKAVRPLVAQMPDQRDAVLFVLGLMGPKAVPALIELVKGKDVDLRALAGDALFEVITPASGGLAPELLACMKDPAVKRSCAGALIKAMGPAAKGQVGLLLEALKSKDAETRAYAAAALGQIGPKAKAAVPELVLSLNDREAMARYASAIALGKIGPKAKAALTALDEASSTQDGEMKRLAREAAKKIRG